MMAGPTPEQVRRGEAMSRLAQSLLDAMAASTYREGEPEAVVDVGLQLETLAYVAAMIIEYLPGMASARDLRRASDDFAARLRVFVKRARAIAEQTGQHPIEPFGASRVMTEH
jgi:hypothetical protein